MNKAKLLKEVEYIDGVQEFLEEGYVTELLAKSSSSFNLLGIPVEGTVRFSGDTTLFNKQVYKKEDLDIKGAWFLDKDSLYINESLKTSDYTYTYITYKRKASNKKEGLFSVDYEKGILYTSTPIKNVKIQYKHAVQFVEGDQMTQVNSSEYNSDSIYNVKTEDQSRLIYEYQVKNSDTNDRTTEYYEDGKVSLLTLGDKDE